MHITIFGASGKTSQLLVALALSQENEVVAFARNPAKLTIQHPKLSFVQGDIADTAAVERAVQGADAVISVLGPTSNAAPLAVTQGTKNILAAMQKQNVKRLVVSMGAGVRDAHDQPKAIDKLIVALLKLVNKNVLEDMVQTANLVRASDRDWTIVRVPMLTDDAATANLRVGAVGSDIGTRVGRADLASFLLKQIKDPTYLRRAPAISS